MVTAAAIRFQDYQFQTIVATGTWRWTTRMDVTGVNPSFQVRDIQAPFGILRDTIPIPGDVITEMANSITEIQSNFPPNIFLGPPSSLAFILDEGRGFGDPQDVVLTNDGVFGSLLGTTLSTSASYLSVAPATVGNLANNESGAFAVSADSTALLAANSPYNETITVQDPNATNTPQTYNVEITVRPKAIIDVVPVLLNFSASRPLTGPFAPVPTQQFTIENTGPADSVLDFQVQRLTDLSNDWLAGFAPVTGTLVSGGSQVVTVQVVPIENLALGVYTEVLRISGYSTNLQVDITINFTVT